MNAGIAFRPTYAGIAVVSSYYCRNRISFRPSYAGIAVVASYFPF